MQKVSLSNKVFTENPLLDEIVYNARQIIFGRVVIKDYDKANNNETLESAKNGDLLVAIGSGTIHFSNFYYDYEFLSTLGKYTDEEALRYAANNRLIPEADRALILSKACTNFLANYVEYNDYYRMLHGEPNYDETGIYEGLWIDTRYIDYYTPTSIEHIYYMPPYEAEYFSLIHELDLTDKNIIYENGTCENIVEDTTTLSGWGMSKEDAFYLLHIGDREVEYYTARVADKFALLYCPSCDSDEVKTRFNDLFEANRKYMLYTIYSEAYKYRSDYYDNFIMVFLTIQTIIDMIVELPEYLIRRDIFDTRTCKYIFESNGVKYFKDIPLKYQISLVKNLNKLIKFKSTDKCIVDITSIFGAESIQVFRYYILKDRNVGTPKKLDYYDNQKEETSTLGKTSLVEDNDKNYELRFIKVPLLGNYDDYIRTDTNIYEYDSITEDDSYWIGDRDEDTVKSDIKDLDFTVLRSKYYSIEAVIDLAKKNFIVTYFMNILMYNKVNTDNLLVNMPNISTTKKFRLVDVIITLFSLSYIYYGVEDTILDSRAKASQILGFNMEADLSKISAWLEEHHLGLTLKDMHVDTFTNPSTIQDFKHLEDIFFTNKDCYDHVISLLNNPPSKEIYDAYKHVYKCLMTMNRNLECFLDKDKSADVYRYQALGYTTVFRNLPRRSSYTKESLYTREYEYLYDNVNDTDLVLDMDDDFSENHKFNLYIKNSDPEVKVFVPVGEAYMCFTYREYLRSVDITLYTFLAKILAIVDFESRQEACINAIQSIISYLKDYISQNGDNYIPLDTVFSGLPSLSMDFIKKYVTEVIDFFKSFKIFTHGSSILYVIQGKFENYVQLIEYILLKYKLDKSELVRIEDAIGGKIQNVSGKLIHTGFGMGVGMSIQDKHEFIDKVWLDITTLVTKAYAEYYNKDNYEQLQDRITDYMERYAHFYLNDTMFTDKYIEEIQDYAIDAMIKFIVTTVPQDYYEIKDTIACKETRIFDDYYNEWMGDLMEILHHMVYDDYCTITDTSYRFTKFNMQTMARAVDNRSNIRVEETLEDDYMIDDSLGMIYTYAKSFN